MRTFPSGGIGQKPHAEWDTSYQQLLIASAPDYARVLLDDSGMWRLRRATASAIRSAPTSDAGIGRPESL